MVVFVCSPYGGKQSNIDKAINYCLMEIELGNTPYAPHVFFTQFMDENTERWEAIQMGLEMLDACAELHVWSNEITDGMRTEIEHAEENGIPVVYMEVSDAK